MTEQIIAPPSELETRFPEAVRPDERKGYQGYLVEPDKLIEVATALRDEMGYDYLSSVTGVDYVEENKLEAVYHFYKSTGGTDLQISVQVDRDNPVIPSLYNFFISADFQEREAWDLLGIKFEGHPDLRRILMWEGFEGHPLRKDWKEAFFSEDSKPYTNRWPEGQVFRAEDNNPLGKNIAYPKGFDKPEDWTPESEDLLYAGLWKYLPEKAGKAVKSDYVTAQSWAAASVHSRCIPYGGRARW